MMNKSQYVHYKLQLDTHIHPIKLNIVSPLGKNTTTISLIESSENEFDKVGK